jgi:hypothetical protein
MAGLSRGKRVGLGARPEAMRGCSGAAERSSAITRRNCWPKLLSPMQERFDSR